VIDVVRPQPVRLPVKPGHSCDGACACGIEPLAHPRWSFGMLLEARHLATEHRYNALRMNTHDIRLHDFGTVCGLRVEKHPEPDCVNTYAILRPGIALDCCGREIVVPESLYVPLYDGATSGWCGAPASAPPATPAKGPRTKLYVYLAYAECETDPIPSYVRACGCCNPCEHGTECVPSMVREGYEVTVSTVAPTAWRNPIGAAFCNWLDAKLKGPGSTPQGIDLVDLSLDQALCRVVTEPCADFCLPANAPLLLATLTFDANDALQTIDNCTNRRLVISTGAIVEAMQCMVAEMLVCCAAADAYVALGGVVAPNGVNIEAPPPGDALTYTITATDADASKNASAFTIDLKFPGGLTFVSAKLAIDGQPQPDPAGDATGVKANVPLLGAGKSAVLTVAATFDPTQRAAGDVLTATASVTNYTGPSAAAISLPVTFTDVRVDGPRVVFKDFPQSLTADAVAAFLTGGWAVPFTEAMNPATAVVDPNAAVGSVYLDLLTNGTPGSLPIAAAWSNADEVLTVTYHNPAITFDPVAMLVQGIEQNPAAQYALRIRLLGGGAVKGNVAVGPCLRGADGQRLDGDPPAGGPPQQQPGQSGDGTQGGDFNWVIPIVMPPDGPHVNVKKSALATKLTAGQALQIFIGEGLSVIFDQPMNTAEPKSGVANPASVSLKMGTTAVTITPTWSDPQTLRIVAAPSIRELLDRGGTLTLTLAGGPKGAGPSPSPALSSSDGRRLDGSPNGQGSASGLSGDGRQGGDFTWAIAVAAG
jgi:hypothetical protein